MKTTTVCRKVIMGASGLILVVFVIAHLLGNLTLFLGADPFNSYAHFLTSLGHGMFIYVAEAGLILFFGMHIITGVRTALQNRSARGIPYQVQGNAGGASRKTVASKTMIVTGLLLLVYTILHVKHFKYGAGVSDGYVTLAHGEEVRDLYRLVVEEFNKPLIAVGYAVCMAFLGFHVRHGFWSAFQSLGAGSRRLTPILNAAGLVIAILLAAGFVLLPLYVLIFLDPETAHAAANTHGGTS